MIKITQQHPQLGVNYGPGWIGFKATRSGFIAKGINWFERWDNISHAPVDHTFNIAGEDLTIEAFANGVEDGSLADYLGDPDTALLVRKPRLLGPQMAAQILQTAASHLGEPYNNALIAAMAIGNTYAGHLVNWATHNAAERFLCWLADRNNKWICSKLVRVSLDHPPYNQYRGVMQLPAYTVNPIDLFEDAFVFEPGAIELVPPGHDLEEGPS
jgi:hypothetical protein